MPTIAEQWKQEGRQEGIEQGELIGRIRMLEEFIGRPISSKNLLSIVCGCEVCQVGKEPLMDADETLIGLSSAPNATVVTRTPSEYGTWPAPSVITAS